MYFDIVFISYREVNAEKNWKLLKEKYPSCLRVHGVEGIAQAHQRAAELSSSSYFFTIDADNIIKDNFEFNTSKIDLEENAIFVWRCENSVNKLVYGYGGVKLWSKKIFEKKTDFFIDHATTAPKIYKIVDEVASTTHFNTSPFESWRSGFREGAKLFRNIFKKKDDFSKKRLESWINVGLDQKYGDWCILGAREGCIYSDITNEEEMAKKVNDFHGLEKMFEFKANINPIKEIVELNSKLSSLALDSTI